MRAAFLLALLAVSGCGLHALRGGAGGPPPEPGRPVFRVWHDEGTWHVRFAPGGLPHRFQGSIEGLTGGLGDPEPVPKQLADRVARIRNAILFDFETDQREEVGFDASSTGGCLRFDLYLDGKRRPDRVRYGARGQVPDHLPAVLCP